jgi:NAD(P)-dependent dehydrogenase (short-subunit alcohol dehydrogenase family)
VGKQFDGAVALVTGAASGIGAATARRLAQDGALVVGLDRNEKGLELLAESVPGVLTLCADLGNSESVDQATSDAAHLHGRIDLLAHIAGVAPSPAVKERAGDFQRKRQEGVPVEGMDGVVALDDEEWRSIMSTNLDGTFHVVRSVLRLMIPQRSGAIVTVSSAAGLGGRAGYSHYCASKAGVKLFTQSAAVEAIGYGIRINAIAPGATATPMFAITPGSMISAYGGIPIGRNAEPEEMAAVIAFLLGPEASYIVGETVNVNGGMVLA